MRVLNDLRFLWALLSLPAVALVATVVQETEAGAVLHSSGELSVRLLVVTLAITPLQRLFPTHRWPRWLLTRRRAFGVASFGYAALHLALYAWFEGLFAEFMAPAILSGWVALAVFVPLAVTSNDRSVRWLGKRWKTLQRGAYLAAALSALHWWWLGHGVLPVLVHFVPLLALQVVRLRGRR